MKAIFCAAVLAFETGLTTGFVNPYKIRGNRRSPCPSVADFEERAKQISTFRLPEVVGQIDVTSSGKAVPSLESPVSEIAQRLSTFLDYLPPSTMPAIGLVGVLGATLVLISQDKRGESPTGGWALSESSLKADPYFSNGRYSAEDAQFYFSTRKNLVARRALRIALLSSGFALSLLLDFALGKIEENSPQRASELVELLTILGPTFIKIGQSLSIRTDLLSPPYLEALTQLQDRVPAFSNAEAVATIEAELGAGAVTGSSGNRLFSSLSADPVAAASLGQVYRATLVDGRDVAVKVQRPGVVESVALDMFLIRSVGPVLKDLFNLNTDVVGTVDDWGRGFVDELDYRLEAANAKVFSEKIEGTPLGSAVFAPPVVDEASTKRVLTTEWVVGERLEKSPASDVTSLVGVCMNTYLTMLLEFGTLHCDPHPGNLLRTPDGRLCILDWGLVTEVPSDTQIKFIEHVAHLTSRDYAEVPADLVALGFVPKGSEEAILQTECVQVLTEVYSEFAGGGGAAKIDVNFVIARLSSLSEKYGNLFQIPPYFAYIARAFGVLEGIGLGNDENFAIVGECLPYISQRLLTDTNPRVGGALDNFVFGSESSSPERVLDAERLELIIEGFGSYSQSTTALTGGEAEGGSKTSQPAQARGGAVVGGSSAASSSSSPTASPPSSSSSTAETLTKEVTMVADQVVELVLTEEMTPLQTLVLDQLAKVVAASARLSFDAARRASGPAPLPLLSLGPLSRLRREGFGAEEDGQGPGDTTSRSAAAAAAENSASERTLLGSLVDPLGLFSGSGLVEVDANDRKALEAAAKLGELLGRSSRENSPAATAGLDPLAVEALTPQELVQVAVAVAQRVGPKLWSKRAQVAMVGVRFAGIALQQQASRLEKRRSASVPAAAAAAAAPDATATPTGSTAAQEDAAPLQGSSPGQQQSGGGVKVPTERLNRARDLLLEVS